MCVCVVCVGEKTDWEGLEYLKENNDNYSNIETFQTIYIVRLKINIQNDACILNLLEGFPYTQTQTELNGLNVLI